jgi:hypothetical protein
MKVLFFFTLISYILSDSIIIKSPLRNQIFLNKSAEFFIIEYRVIRDNNNNRLLVNHTTTDILTSQKNLLVSYKRNIINSTLIRINVNSLTIQNDNKISNFTIRIIASGRYRNNRTIGQFLVNIPIQVKLNVTNEITQTIFINTDIKPTQESTYKNNGLKVYVNIVLLLLFIFILYVDLINCMV